MKTVIFLLSLLFVLQSCGRFPKDTDDTLEKVRGKELKIGVAENNRSTVHQIPDEAVKALATAYAQNIGANPKWVYGSQSDVIELLKNHEVDMAIGGFTTASPFKKEVAFSKPCFIDTIKIGATSSTNMPGNIEDATVYVDNLLTAIYVKEKKAKPILVNGFSNRDGLYAGSVEELQQHHLQLSGYNLHENKFVIAIPRGENAYLMDLEKFIDHYDKR